MFPTDITLMWYFLKPPDREIQESQKEQITSFYRQECQYRGYGAGMFGLQVGNKNCHVSRAASNDYFSI